MMTRWGWRPGGKHATPKIGHCGSYPYPKTLGGWRPMAVLHVTDRLAARALVARMGEAIDAGLSDRFYAHRLDRRGPGWTLRDYSDAHQAYQSDRLESLACNRWQYTLITDLSRFYPSIDPPLLLGDLSALGCDSEALGMLDEMWGSWRQRDGLVGLPMGEEAFGVISSPMLRPVDDVLFRVADDHFMYGDDTTMFHADVASGKMARAELESVLAERRLKLSLRKTYEIFDADEAWVAVENDRLSSMSVVGGRDDQRGLAEVWKLWDELLALPRGITDPQRIREVHFALGWLRRQSHPYAADTLVRRLDIMQLTPRLAVNYLIEVGRRDQAVIEAMARAAAIPITPTTEALVLHALRFAAGVGRPADEFTTPALRVLDNQRAHAATRAWAAMAHSCCSTWRCDDALERAEAEADFWVTRAVVASTKADDKHDRLRRRALRAFGGQRSDLAAVCEWAQKRAA